MDTIDPTDLSITREYRVTGAAHIRDSVGCPIDPELAAVRFTNRRYHSAGFGPLRPSSVTITGRRTRGKKTAGQYSETSFRVAENGTIEPHYKYGPAPAWVLDVVSRAVTDQAKHRVAALRAATDDVIEARNSGDGTVDNQLIDRLTDAVQAINWDQLTCQDQPS